MNIFKRIISYFFPVENIKTALNVRLAVSEEMLGAIEVWHNAYIGKAPWLSEDVISLRLEKSVSREFANVCLNEMTVNCSDDFLTERIKQLTHELSGELQSGLATGAMVIKPVGQNGLQFLDQSRFLPIEYSSGKGLKNVIFPEIKKVGDYFYTRLEQHILGENGLTITNTAYRSATQGVLGQRMPLGVLDEWSKLPEKTVYPDMKRQAFGYYRNPLANTIDNSGAGMSICDDALDIICCADRQFGRIDWEFESGERAVHVDSTAVKLSDGRFVTDHTYRRLYRGLNLDLNSGDLFSDYSPTIRQSDLIAGLDEYKREIEFAVGLSFGDISNPQSVDKTATEIIAAKQRKYNMVTAIQKNLRSCIEETVYAIAFYNRRAASGYELTVDFKDSILTDEKEERQQDERDLANGIMRPEEYRAKWYGEELDTALKNLPQNSDVIE